MKKRFAAFVLTILGVFSTSFGQNEGNEASADRTLRGGGRVNASTLGMEFELPLGNYPGRGIDVPINLSYSSKLWRMEYLYHTPMPGGNYGGCYAVYAPMFSEESASGWTTSMAVPYIEYIGGKNIYNNQGSPVSNTGECEPNTPPNYSPNTYVRRLLIHLPSGETHELRPDDSAVFYSSSGSSDPNGPYQPHMWNATYYAADGSNIKYIQDSSNGTYRLLMPDGSFYDFDPAAAHGDDRKAVKFTDRNGNYTTYHAPGSVDENGAAHPNGYWKDTLGRNLSVPFGLQPPAAPTTEQNPQVYSMPGMTGTYKFHWKRLNGGTQAESALTDISHPDYQLKYFGDKYICNNPNPTFCTRPSTTTLFHSEWESIIFAQEFFNPVVLTEIELPTGQKYKFGYDVYGRIEKITYPTGGREVFRYNVIPSLSLLEPNDVGGQTNYGVVNRRVFQTAGQGAPYEWAYSAAQVAPAGYKISTTSPDGTISERIMHRNSDTSGVGTHGYDTVLAGMPYEVNSYSNTGQILSKKLTVWTKTSFGIAEWHPRIAQEESIVYDTQGNAVSATTVYEYDGDLNRRETPVLQSKTKQFAFVAAGSPLPANPVRASETIYLINDANYPLWVRDIYKNQNMIGLATTSVVRDAANTIVSRSEMKYDDGGFSPNIGRGNPTTSRVWDSTKGDWNDPGAYLTTRARFDNWGNQTEAIDAKGNSTLTEFDSAYLAFPLKVTSTIPDPSGQNGSNTPFETRATFDFITGLPLTSIDANGLEIRTEYDPATLRPLRTKTFYQNQQIGPASETVYHDEPNNYWIKSRTQIDTDKWAENITYFDGLGRAYKAEEINSRGNIYVEKEFDAEGRVKRVTNPFRSNEAKIWTTNVYDEASRIKEVVLPDGSKVKTDYGVLISDIVGVTKQITDPAGKKRKGITDALGRMIRVIEDPSGQNLSTDYVFDTLGNLRKTAQGEQSRHFTHDSLGRLLYAKHPEQESNASFAYTDSITGNAQWSVKYEYDDNGNITRTTDARGIYVQGTYDNFNRLKSRNYSDATPDVSFYYDGRGLTNVPAFSKGKTTRVQSGVSETRYTSFDSLGRLLTHQQITDGQIYNTSFQYDAFGKLLAEIYPSGRIVKFEYNQDGDMASIRGALGTNNRLYANAISYNSSGSIERLRLGNGKWETVSYNNRLQITEIGLGNSAVDKSLLKLEYGYGDDAQNSGSLKTQRISFQGLSQPFEQIYNYDDLNRLQSATEIVSNQITWKQTFTYDRYGNRRFDAANTTTLLQSDNITNPNIDTATNRFSSNQGYEYDKDGNLTLDAENRRFVYDAENRLKEFFGATNNTATPDAVYYYDGEGKRIKKISSTETVIFVYDGAGKLVAEYSTELSEAPQVSYLTKDHLGSPRIITGALGGVIARKDFSAFGDETLTPQRTESLGYKAENIRQDYTGYQKDDESGLEFAQARYYDPTHGRFTSIDPLAASANIKNPQTFNRYSYVLNSPYKFVDPLGLISEYAGSPCGNRCQNSDGSNGPTQFDDNSWKVWRLPERFDPAEAAPPPPPAAEQNADDPIAEAGKKQFDVQWDKTVGTVTLTLADGTVELTDDMVKALGNDATEFVNLDAQISRAMGGIQTALSDLAKNHNFAYSVVPGADGKLIVTLTNSNQSFSFGGSYGPGSGGVSISPDSKTTNVMSLVDSYNSLVQKRNDLYTERKTEFQNKFSGTPLKITSINWRLPREVYTRNRSGLSNIPNRNFLGVVYTSRIGSLAGQIK